MKVFKDDLIEGIFSRKEIEKFIRREKNLSLFNLMFSFLLKPSQDFNKKVCKEFVSKRDLIFTGLNKTPYPLSFFGQKGIVDYFFQNVEIKFQLIPYGSSIWNLNKI